MQKLKTHHMQNAGMQNSIETQTQNTQNAKLTSRTAKLNALFSFGKISRGSEDLLRERIQKFPHPGGPRPIKKIKIQKRKNVECKTKIKNAETQNTPTAKCRNAKLNRNANAQHAQCKTEIAKCRRAIHSRIALDPKP